jgi:hypothetical protein
LASARANARPGPLRRTGAVSQPREPSLSRYG